MKILALDSSSAVGSVSLCEDRLELGHFFVNNGNTHSETLLPMVENLLDRLSLSVSDIDLFAVSNGPGSFTGLRIGAATIKGLAFGKDIPAVGVSTLEAIAYSLVEFPGILVPVMNARRDQMFTSFFSTDGKTLQRLTEDCVLTLEELDTLLHSKNEKIYLCGDGYDLAKDALTVKTETTPRALREASAYSVAQVARMQYETGIRTKAAQLSPIYLRKSQAERQREEMKERKD